MVLFALGFVMLSPSAAASTIVRAQDANTQQKLTTTLQQRVPMAVISVRVANGTATLTGTASRLCDRILAEELAHSTPGISAVRDEIELITLPVDDKELAQELLDKLRYSRADAGFTFPNVKLTVKDGVVTAVGEVKDAVERSMVRSMIASEDGVKGLNDELNVSSTYDLDEETRIAVAKALAGEPVNAKVEFGVVHLMGSVPTQDKATDVANRVRNISGVIGVENELAVKPSPIADLSLTSFINDDVHR